MLIIFYLALFFGGAFLANGVPHFVNGLSGRKFPTPLSNPPGKGETSAVGNALWGLFNFFVAYLLLWQVGHFDYRFFTEFAVVFAGALVLSLLLARHFGKIDS